MPYNPNIHHRRSIRLKGYDYSQPGAYFVTICTQNRAHLFGNVVDGKMVLNDAGQMVEKWYFELENKFPDILCDAYVVMPDHFHAIIINVSRPIPVVPVGADLRVCPNVCPNVCPPDPDKTTDQNKMDETDNRGQLGNGDETDNRGNRGERDDRGERGNRGERGTPDETGNRGEHVGSPLRGVVQWFKTMTTNGYIRGVKQSGWAPFPGKLWQRNYYERIIRNEIELNRVREYIINNPLNWGKKSR